MHHLICQFSKHNICTYIPPTKFYIVYQMFLCTCLCMHKIIIIITYLRFDKEHCHVMSCDISVKNTSLQQDITPWANQLIRDQTLYQLYTTLMSSNESKTAICGPPPPFDDLDDWEVIACCHLNRTSAPQLIETLVISARWCIQ